MKISVCSDLHLEFGTISLENTDGADVLVLSGDIMVARDLNERDTYNIMGEQNRSNKFHTFFQECCARFPHVIYVMGNHEHYDGDFATTEFRIRSHLGYLKNLHFLEKESVKIDDVTFIGGTLWTDMNNEDSLTLYHIRRMMNDFRIVKNSNRKLTRKVPLYKMNPDYTEDGKNGRKYLLDEKGNMIEDGFKHIEEDSTFCPEDAVEEFDHVLVGVSLLTKESSHLFVLG